MSTTEQPPSDQAGPRVSSAEVRDLGRLRRTVNGSPEGRHLGGVAGGLARHLDIDPVIMRVVFVVLVFFGGAGILLYVAGCLFVPAEDTDRAPIDLDPRTRSFVLYIAGGISVLALLGDSFGRWAFPWPLLAIGLIALVVLGRGDRFRAAQRDQADPTPPPHHPPRRRGPILFWFTLALMALLEGALGLIDVAGADVSASAYAALAVGVTGVMLVLGAFWGRAGGLTMVGLVATMWLAGSVAAEQIDRPSGQVYAAPTTAAAAITGDYEIGAGELLVDLTKVSDPAALDDHTLKIGAGIGKVSVVVPDQWSVQVDANVGVGEVMLLDGPQQDGLGVDASGSVSGDAGQPSVDLVVHLGVGAVEIKQESDFQWPDYSGWSRR
ncbi:PspC domain-containing protein [Nocardioides sp.]|uniref:PspC domain-containing protein n=1 Tax=Nocardioides sp. TaxID=35761 RepID=UPI0039E6768A